MEVNLVTEGLKFMALGMTTVFLFLILMVVVMNIQAKLVNKFFPQKVTPSSSKKSMRSHSATKQDDGATVAAIIAAISEFKKFK